MSETLATPLLDLIRNDQLEVAFFKADGRDAFPPGFVHEKIVPFGIIAQATIGHYEITCRDETVSVSGDEAFLTPANAPLRIVHHDQVGRFAARWLHFSFVLYQTLEITSLLSLPLRVDATVGRQIGELIAELRDLEQSLKIDIPMQRLIRSARQREVAWHVLGILCELARPGPRALDYVETGKRLQPLLQHLDAHLADPINVPGMARLANMSTSRLHAYFSDRLGCTPMGYVTQLRLKRAATLLSQWRHPSIKEVAAETGFANGSHLSREFKRRYGLSPSRFREGSSGP